MTDNEIIKALECCANWQNDKSCEECPANTYGFGCANKMAKYAIDLINRQNAEIERYKGVIKILENDIEIAKAEAIKEFAERLRERYESVDGQYIDRVLNSDIDTLIKEMTEVQE